MSSISDKNPNIGDWMRPIQDSWIEWKFLTFEDKVRLLILKFGDTYDIRQEIKH